MAARDLTNTRNAVSQTVNGVNRKYNDTRSGRKGRNSSRAKEISELREAALEAASAEKEFVEEGSRKEGEKWVDSMG
ncbi:hypothetical protein VNO77_19700 [Canavalia gladiata]|uniref:Uncharacterized protein n=1 Tax=Canavalia gladiata TaxID=3824 RepID=A0AAN9LN35_CANGL